MRIIAIALFIAFLPLGMAEAQVVALGSSNTQGYDLPLSDAWPAKLEALLRVAGQNVTVSNKGINGDTSTGMLQRFDAAVPPGTRVLLLECCGNDNKDRNPRLAVADHAGNVRALLEKAKARGIPVVYLANGYQHEKDTAALAAARETGAEICGGILAGVPSEHLRPDTRAGTHADAAGYEIVARRVLPCVLRALGAAH